MRTRWTNCARPPPSPRPPLARRCKLFAPEAIAHAQANRPRAIHRDRLIPLAVVGEELGARVGQILAVSLYQPSVLTRTERRIVGGEGRQVVSHRLALQVEREPVRGRQ